MTLDNPTPAEIHRLDQAAVDAFDDVDTLATDPETKARLDRLGPAVYAAQLAADLDANVLHRMGLAGIGAMATIRRVQERERHEGMLSDAKYTVGQVLKERDVARAEVTKMQAALNGMAAVIDEARRLRSELLAEKGRHDRTRYEHRAVVDAATAYVDAVHRAESENPDNRQAEEDALIAAVQKLRGEPTR